MDIVGAQQDLYYCSVCLKSSSKNLKQRMVSRLAHAEINKSVRDHSEAINTFNYLIQKNISLISMVHKVTSKWR